eukprot:366363-Chlamydomonas_euryale.AAC.17
MELDSSPPSPATNTHLSRSAAAWYTASSDPIASVAVMRSASSASTTAASSTSSTVPPSASASAIASLPHCMCPTPQSLLAFFVKPAWCYSSRPEVRLGGCGGADRPSADAAAPAAALGWTARCGRHGQPTGLSCPHSWRTMPR